MPTTSPEETEAGFRVRTAEGQGVVVPDVADDELESSFDRLAEASRQRLRGRADGLRKPRR